MTQRYDPAGCTRCLFRNSHLKTCDFMWATGYARMKICPPGKACTVRAETRAAYYARCRQYITGTIPPPPADGMDGHRSRTRLDESRAWQLYTNERCNDKEIAEKLGVTQAAIFRWRKKNALPTNYRKKK